MFCWWPPTAYPSGTSQLKQDTVLFQSICLSCITSQVVLDEIGACPMSHEEWLASKNHWQNGPITNFFWALQVPTSCKCSFVDNRRYSSTRLGCLHTVKLIGLFASLPTPQLLINDLHFHLGFHHLFKLLSESTRNKPTFLTNNVTTCLFWFTC